MPLFFKGSEVMNLALPLTPPIPSPCMLPLSNPIAIPHPYLTITSDHQYLLVRADQSLGIQIDSKHNLLHSYNKEYNHIYP